MRSSGSPRLAGRPRRLTPGACLARYACVKKLATDFQNLVACFDRGELDLPDQPRPGAAVHRARPGDAAARHRASLGIAGRSAYGIVTGLAEAGYIVKQKNGRRNRDQIQAHLPLPEPASRERTSARSWSSWPAPARGLDRRRADASDAATDQGRRHRKPAGGTRAGCDEGTGRGRDATCSRVSRRAGLFPGSFWARQQALGPDGTPAPGYRGGRREEHGCHRAQSRCASATITATRHASSSSIPVSHNTEWRAVVSLLEAVGSVVQHHDGPPLPSGLRPNSSTLPRTRTSTPARLSTGAGC
jgi:hypothetical protein